MATAYIGLGSNLSDPEQQIRHAVTHIEQMPNCELNLVSSLYFSKPMGPKNQPDYMNAVLELNTSLSAIALLDQLQAIENKAGRVRKDNRWGPRILDLDILLFDNQTITTERLTIPHYGLKEREFVLIPLHEINQQLLLPSGESIKQLLNTIDENGLKIHSKLR